MFRTVHFRLAHSWQTSRTVLGGGRGCGNEIRYTAARGRWEQRADVRGLAHLPPAMIRLRLPGVRALTTEPVAGPSESRATPRAWKHPDLLRTGE